MVCVNHGHIEMQEHMYIYRCSSCCNVLCMCVSSPVPLHCRCFALVEYTSLEQVATLDRMVSSVSSENHESIMGMGTAGTVHSVLIQCSPSIFQVSVKST